jgi:hypothetical protein
MATNSGLTYLSGLLRAGAEPVGAGARAPRSRVAAQPRANTSPHASPSASPAPADHAGEVSRPLERGAAERAAHTSASTTLREDAAESRAPVVHGASPVRGVAAARHEQPVRVSKAPPQEDSQRRGLSDPAKAVESDAARTGTRVTGSTAPTPHTLEAHVNQLRAHMQTRGAEASHAEGEGAAGKTSRAAIAPPRAAVGAMQTQRTQVAKQPQPAHAPASRTRESQEGSAARMASPAHAPKLTIHRLDVQVVNRADPQPPAPPAPPASASPSQPDAWGAPDRSFLGRFF